MKKASLALRKYTTLHLMKGICADKAKEEHPMTILKFIDNDVYRYYGDPLTTEPGVYPLIHKEDGYYIWMNPVNHMTHRYELDMNQRPPRLAKFLDGSKQPYCYELYTQIRE